MKHGKADHASLEPAAKHKPIAYPKADGVLTFDRLSSVFLSNTNHEEDQPVHLKVRDMGLQKRSEHDVYAGPSSRYCPAAVYEWVEEPQRRGEGPGSRCQVRDQRAELRALQNLRHQGSQPEHRLGAAAGRRGSGLPEHVSNSCPSRVLKRICACGVLSASREAHHMRPLVIAAILGVGVLPTTAGPTLASVSIKAKTVTYSISGKNGDALLEAMDRRGPKHGFLTRAIAQTRYVVNWDIDWQEKDGGCRIANAAAGLSITYTYPAVTSRMSPALDRAMDALHGGRAQARRNARTDCPADGQCRRKVDLGHWLQERPRLPQDPGRSSRSASPPSTPNTRPGRPRSIMSNTANAATSKDWSARWPRIGVQHRRKQRRSLRHCRGACRFAIGGSLSN